MKCARFIVSRPRARELVFRPFVRYPARMREDLLAEQIESGLKQSPDRMSTAFDALTNGILADAEV